LAIGTLTGGETVRAIAVAQKMLPRLVCAAAVTAALSGAAFAQFPTPSINLEQEKHRTPQEIERDKAIDRAYKSATQKIPDQRAANDPWADIRPTPPAPPQKKKQQVSQEKKHAE